MVENLDILQSTELTNGDKVVACTLRMMAAAGQKNPTHAEVARRCNMAKGTVADAVQKLRKLGIEMSPVDQADEANPEREPVVTMRSVVEFVEALRSVGLEAKTVEYSTDLGSVRITCKADL